MSMCSVCAGTGKPLSGLPCICGGSGLETDEIAGLRVSLFEAYKKLGAIEEALVGLAKQCKNCGGIGYTVLEHYCSPPEQEPCQDCMDLQYLLSLTIK
jgi:hypothetical protein